MTGRFLLCLNMILAYIAIHPMALRGLITTTSSMPSSIMACGMKSMPPGIRPQLANRTLRIFRDCSGWSSRAMDTFLRRPGRCLTPASV